MSQLSRLRGAALLIVLASLAPAALADACTSMVPYLRDIKQSMSNATSSSAAMAYYGSMLIDTMKRAESESGDASVNAIGYGDASAKQSKAKEAFDFHSANVQSQTASSASSAQAMVEFTDIISKTSADLVAKCLTRRGVDYSFVIGNDGQTFFIKATFRTPSTEKVPVVNVRKVLTGTNVQCDDSNFKTIDAGSAAMKCVRKNKGGDSIMIVTDYDGDSKSDFLVPDVRPRYREEVADLDLAWCGFPGCTQDMRRHVAWNPVEFLKKTQPANPLSCDHIPLKDLGVLKDGDILRPDQTFPLQLTSTTRGNWGAVHQDTANSVPVAKYVIALCGTRDEPFDDWPNLIFGVRTQVRFLRPISY